MDQESGHNLPVRVSLVAVMEASARAEDSSVDPTEGGAAYTLTWLLSGFGSLHAV